MSTQLVLPLKGSVTELPLRLSDALAPSAAALSLSVLSQKQCRLLAFCVEPGMGAAELLDKLVQQAQDQGFIIHDSRFGGLDSETASKRLTQIARKCEKTKEKALYVLRMLPPADESHVFRQSRAIRRLCRSGARVLLWVYPEDRQLVEELRESAVFGIQDLLSPEVAEASPASPLYRLRTYTRGIVTLLDTFALSETNDYRTSEPGVQYRETYGDLLKAALRSSLTKEELRLRLCMLLMGSGTIGDLETVVCRFDRSYLEKIRDTSPLFGVSPDLSAFAVLGADSLEVSESCKKAMGALCDAEPDLFFGAVRYLIREGRIRRCGAILELSCEEEADRAVYQHADLFIAEGKAALVEKALAHLSTGPEFYQSRYAYLEASLDFLADRSPAREFPQQSNSTGTPGSNPGTELLLDCSKALFGVFPEALPEHDHLSKLGRDLSLHVRFMQLFASGRLKEAMNLLVMNEDDRNCPSLGRLFLRMDRELGALFLLQPSSKPCRIAAEAREFFSAGELFGYMGYVHLLEIADMLFSSEEDPELTHRFELISSRQERDFVMIVVLMAGAFVDLRNKNYSRAHVRADLIQKKAAFLGLGYYLKVGVILKVLSCFYLRESILPFLEFTKDDDELSAVLSCVLASCDPRMNPELPEKYLEETPGNSLWLLSLLASDLPVFSSRFLCKISDAWKDALLRSGAIKQEELREMIFAKSRNPLSSSPFAVYDDERPIEVRLLGSFALWVRGVRVPDREIMPRNAAGLLEYLLLCDGCSARRYQVVDELWPQSEPATGINNVYQATSVIRRAVRSISPSLSILSSPHESNCLTLNTALLRCDVFELKSLAARLFASHDRKLTVELAEAVDELYRGDLCLCSKNPYGRISMVVAEIKNLYVDAMLAGSKAALELSMEPTGVRLITRAVCANPLREDVVRELIRILRQSGRGAEAERLYREFVRNNTFAVDHRKLRFA